MEALEMALLFDYYGELLTERQRSCVDMRYNQDLSLSEIAEELGVSRQGVYDNLSRAEALLRNMEEKTGCVQRAMKTRKAVREILDAADKKLIIPMNPHCESLNAAVAAAIVMWQMKQ